MPKKEIINITLIHVIMSKFVDSLAKLKKNFCFSVFVIRIELYFHLNNICKTKRLCFKI